MEEVIKSTTAAMAILQGAQEISALLDKKSALNVFLNLQYRKLAGLATKEQAVSTVALAAAEETQIATTEGATVAQVGLNAAMEANPVGILLLGATALISAYEIFATKTKDASEEEVKLNKHLTDTYNIAKDLQELKKFSFDFAVAGLENELSLMRARKASQDEILKKELEIANLKNQQAEKDKQDVSNRVKGITDGLADFSLHLKSLDIQPKDRINTKIKPLFDQIVFSDDPKVMIDQLEKAQKALEKLKATSPNKKNDISILEETATRLHAQIQDVVQVTIDAKNAQSDLASKTAELNKQLSEEALRSVQGFSEAALINAQKNTRAELNAQIEAIKARSAVELENESLTAGEKAKILAQEQRDIEDAERNFHILQLNNQKSLLQAKLAETKEGSAEELRIRIALINESASIELAQEGVTTEKTKQIRSEAARQIADLQKKFNQEAIADDVNSVISGLNARLAAVKEGSESEMIIKKDLVDQKALLDINSASAQIKNEKLLAARIGEINAKAIEDKKKLDDEYYDHLLELQTRAIERQTKQSNLQFEAILGNPNSTSTQKNDAQLKILENARLEVFKKIYAVESQISSGTGNTNELLEKRKDLYLDLQKIIDQINNQTTKAEKDLLAELQSKAQGLVDSWKSLATSVSGFNSDLSKTIQLFATIGDSVIKVSKGLADFKTAKNSGDSAGQVAAATDIASAVLNAIQSAIEDIKAAKAAKKAADQQMIDFQTQLITGEEQYQATLRERARIKILDNKLTIEGLQAQKTLLEQQKQTNQSAFNDVMSKLQNESFVSGLSEKEKVNFSNALKGVAGIFGAKKTVIDEATASLAGKSFDDLEQLFTKGQLTGKAKELFEELQKLKQEGADIDAMLEENKQKAQEVFTGTTSDGILDSIVDGFKNGLHTASDFAGTFEDLMRGAMINALKFQYLEAPLKDFFAQFADATQSDNTLSQSEIDNLHNTFNAIIANADQQFQQLQQISGLNLGGGSSTANSVIGGIKSMTEQTAELLAGQFGGLRITALDQLNVARQALIVQQSIENSTALTVARLEQMTDKMYQWFMIQGIKVQ
jgi:hypothetical protein